MELGKNNGFKNEDIFLEHLNKPVSHLPEKTYIKLKRINNNSDFSNISCEKKAGQFKPDLIVKIDSTEYNLSLKIGKNNSVHEECVNNFCNYLIHKLNVNSNVCNYIKLYIWGDGTLDGSSQKFLRMNVNKIKKTYPYIINSIQEIFNQHKEILLRRFLITGKEELLSPHVDYFIYGGIDDFRFLDANSAIKQMLKIEKSYPSIGPLGFQAKHRSLAPNYTKPERRGNIQLKWNIDTSNNDLIWE